MMKWDTAALEAAERALRGSQTYDQACEALQAALGPEATYAAVKRAFSRHGKGSAWSYLGAKKPEPAAFWSNVTVDPNVPKSTPIIGFSSGSWEIEEAQRFKPTEAAHAYPKLEFSVTNPDPSRIAKLMADELRAIGTRKHTMKWPSVEAFDDEMKIRPTVEGPLRRVLLVPDAHHPYVDRLAWQLALKVASAFKPDIVVTMGDFADFYCLSTHRKKPSPIRNMTFERELEAANLAYDELEAATPTATRRIAICGNHEERLERYLADNAREVYSMLGIREAFRFAERGYEYVPYQKHMMLGKMLLTHDVGYSGANAHVKTQAACGTNVCIGHTHRMAVTYTSSVLGETHVGAMLGWIGDRDAADYMYSPSVRDWTHGVGLAYLAPNGDFFLTPTPFVNGRALVEGNLISL